MAFRVLPTSIKDPQADAKAINENFEATYSDLVDMGGSLSTTASTGGLATDPTAPPFTKIRTVNVSVNNSDLALRGMYSPERTPIIPRVDIYVDNDLDSNYLWPVGDSLSDSQKSLDVSVITPAGTANFADDENTVASFYIKLENTSGVDAHTYYVYVNTFIYPSPHVSRFNS